MKDKGSNPYILENQPILSNRKNKNSLSIEIRTFLHEGGRLPHKQNIHIKKKETTAKYCVQIQKIRQISN